MSHHCFSRGTRGRRFAGDARGAVLAEFVIAIVPLIFFFFTLAQLTYLMIVELNVRHAAFVAARASMVVAPGMQDSGAATDVTAAAKYLLEPLGGTVAPIAVAANDHSQHMVTTKVSFTYRCGVPLGNRVCCGGGTKVFEAEASMPNQGSKLQDIVTE